MTASRQVRGAALLVGPLLLAGVAGCSWLEPTAPPCLPPSFSVAPATVSPGATVTVTAANAECDPRYGGDAQVRVTLTDAEGRQILEKKGSMDDAGAFRLEFTVPARTAPGKAMVTAEPHNVDWCDDTGRNNRVSEGGEKVIRTSCALPSVPLTVQR